MSPYSTATCKLWCPWNPATVPLRHLRLVESVHHNWSLQSTSGRHDSNSICLEPSPTNAKNNKESVTTGYWYYKLMTFKDEKKCISNGSFRNICLETFIYRYLKAPLQKMSFLSSLKFASIQKIRFQKHQTFEQLLLWSQLSAQLLCFGAMDFVVPSAGRCASLQDANLILQARPWSNKITPAMRETRESPLRLKTTKFYPAIHRWYHLCPIHCMPKPPVAKNLHLKNL